MDMKNLEYFLKYTNKLKPVVDNFFIQTSDFGINFCFSFNERNYSLSYIYEVLLINIKSVDGYYSITNFIDPEWNCEIDLTLNIDEIEERYLINFLQTLERKTKNWLV